MNIGNFKEFEMLLNGIYEFYNKKPNDFVRDVWWAAMRGYDYDAVRDAMNRHLMNPDSGQFLPKPADIVKMIDGGTADSALVGWSKFDKAVRSVGPYMSIVFDDPIIHRVIEDMGGWTSFATKTDDEWPFIKNEFVTRYRGYSTRKVAIEYKPKMLGMIDADRESKGLAHDANVLRLVGDVAKAADVMRLGNSSPSIGISTVHQAGLKLIGEVK